MNNYLLTGVLPTHVPTDDEDDGEQGRLDVQQDGQSHAQAGSVAAGAGAVTDAEAAKAKLAELRARLPSNFPQNGVYSSIHLMFYAISD